MKRMIVKEWLIRLALIVFGFIVAIVALEFGLSKFAAHPEDVFAILHERDKYIGWKGIPNKEGKNRLGRIESYVKINSHGFRDKERTYEKKKGVFRILVLGDSMTEAIQVPLQQTFPYILEEKLNSGNNRTFEAINLGIVGFGTSQEYLTLKHYGLKYQPDFVILAFFIGNDVLENSFTLRDKPSSPYFVLNSGKLEEIPPKIEFGNPSKDEEKRSTGQFQTLQCLSAKFFPNIYYFLGDRIERTSWLANFLWKMSIKNSKPALIDKSKKSEIPIYMSSYDIYGEEYSPEWQDAWEVTKALILKLAKELETDKIGFLVVIIPYEFEFRPDIWGKILDEYPQLKAIKFDLRKPERILSDFLEANKIDYLLLRPEFEKYTKETGKDLHFHRLDNHWNVNGHALAAELIYGKLKDDKLVPIKGEE